MENPEEILHSLEEFSKLRPKDIPRELEDYLCFVAKTGDPIYQWSTIKSLFREKLLSVITEFYESCPSIEIPPCPNVDMFNYEAMKNFILEKLDTFAAAPFTVQRICELLTTPRKEYNRIDKYMRALEKNILVVSTTEPGNNRRSIDNADGIVNGLESDHVPEPSNSNNDINVEEMDDSPSWPRTTITETSPETTTINTQLVSEMISREPFVSESRVSSDGACSSFGDTVITCRNAEETYVFIEPVPSNTCRQVQVESDVSVTITAIPADVQKRKDNLEPVVSSETTENTEEKEEQTAEDDITDNDNTIPESTNNEAEQAEQVPAAADTKPEEDEPSEDDEMVDSTSQSHIEVTEQKEEPLVSEKPSEEPETSNNVESTSAEAQDEVEATLKVEETVTEETEEIKEEPTSEVSVEATPEESEAEKAVVSTDTSVSSPPAAEDVSEIPKHESESEENSKDSEVSSSSSSVASVEEDNSEDSQKQSGDQIVPDFGSEKEAKVEDAPKESNEAENKEPEEKMEVDEAGDAKSTTPDEEITESKTEEVTESKTEDVTESKTEEVAESKTEEVAEPKTEEVTEPKTEEVTQMDVEVADSVTEKPVETEEVATASTK